MTTTWSILREHDTQRCIGERTAVTAVAGGGAGVMVALATGAGIPRYAGRMGVRWALVALPFFTLQQLLQRRRGGVGDAWNSVFAGTGVGWFAALLTSGPSRCVQGAVTLALLGGAGHASGVWVMQQWRERGQRTEETSEERTTGIRPWLRESPTWFPALRDARRVREEREAWATLHLRKEDLEHDIARVKRELAELEAHQAQPPPRSSAPPR